MLVLLSFFIRNSIKVPDNVIFLSSLFSMPEGADFGIDTLFNQLFGKFYDDEKEQYLIWQNDGSVTDIEQKRTFYDLSETPDDIYQSTQAAVSLFDKEGYTFDGTVNSETYIQYQATDSFDKTYVRNVTVSTDIDVESIINSGCSLPVSDCKEPTVLIYHTHSTESYIPHENGKFSTDYPGRNSNKNQNMIRVGEEIAAVLAARGIGVIHDTNIYDEVYTGAYEKSRNGVEAILEKYPSIVITLDIHRDAIYQNDLTRIKPVTEIDGKKAAQLMIITGAEGGNVETFKNWQTNLSFALNLQNAVNTKYENLMKPTYFCNRKYNMDLTPYSLLIEVGTDVNTLEEAAYSARLLGDCLAEFIKNNMEK